MAVSESKEVYSVVSGQAELGKGKCGDGRLEEPQGRSGPGLLTLGTDLALLISVILAPCDRYGLSKFLFYFIFYLFQSVNFC